MVASRGTPLGQICFQQADGSDFRKQSRFSEEARESRSCSRKGCCLRRSHGKKMEKQQMGTVGREVMVLVQLKYQIKE